MSTPQTDVWVVVGPTGSGKTTVADILLSLLYPTPALVDKDTLYDPLVSAMSAAAGRPLGEREGDWYDVHIKPYVYAGIFGTVREIRSKGCAVVLSMPFTKQTQHANAWAELVEQLGGGTVRLVWVHSDAATLRQRIESRGSDRDTEKLRKFQEFIDRAKPEVPPPLQHIAIDNRLSAKRSIEDQLKPALAELDRSTH